MRVLIITQKFPPRELGGADLISYDLARGIKNSGHEPYVICAENVSDPTVPDVQVRIDHEPYNDIPVWRISFNWQENPDPYWSIYGINTAVEKAITDLLSDIQPDVVHVTSCSMITAAALTAPQFMHLPLVLTLTGKWEICPIGTLLRRDGTLCSGRQAGMTCLWCILGETKTYRGLKKLPTPVRNLIINFTSKNVYLSNISSSLNFIHTIERRNQVLPDILQGVDKITSPSICHIQLFNECGMVSKDKIDYSAHGRDLDQVGVPQSRASSDKIRFAYTGQIVPHKGVDTLIEAFKLIPTHLPAELQIFGNPDLDSRCRHYPELARDHANIIWKGAYDHGQVREILSNIDVVVVPSNCIENSPGTIAEAFATGVPVIGSDVCGVSEHIHDGIDGLLFQRRNQDDLAQKMIRILTEPELLDHLRAGISQPRRLTESVSEFIDIYNCLLATPGQ